MMMAATGLLYYVSIEIQKLSSTDCNFQGLAKAMNIYFKI